MAFSLGNIIKAAAGTALKAVAPITSTVSNLYKAGASAVSSLMQPKAPAGPSSLFSSTGQQPSNGFIPSSGMPPVPSALPSATAFNVPTLPKAGTPIAATTPSTAGQSLTYQPPPAVPPTINAGTLAGTSPSFTTVPSPVTPTYAVPTFTAPGSPAPTTPGAAGATGTTTPTTPAPGTGPAPAPGGTISPDLLNQSSDQDIRGTQNRITETAAKIAGKSTALAAAEAAARVPEQQQQLNDVINQINTLNSDAAAETIKIQGKPVANIFQSRQIGAVERDRTVRVLGLSAVASALQGNLALARDYAQKSVDAKFAPMEAELASLRDQLEFNKDNFTRAESARADKLKIALSERERALEDDRTRQTQINSIALEAAKTGADAETLNAILGASDLGTALGAARSALAKKNGIGVYNLSEAQANIASKLADDFEKASGQFSQVRDAYGRIQAAQQGTGISDTALIFAYMKMLDPGSVVREGEFATVANAGGIPAQVMNAYNKAINGDKLPAEIRQQVLSTSGELYTKALSTQSQINNQFSSRASAYGIPTDLVTRDLTAGIGAPGQAVAIPREQVFARLKAKYPGVDDARLNTATDQFLNNPDRMKELGFNQDLGTSQNGLGNLSAKYESGGDPGAIGFDKTGGLSYGVYQLSHNNAQNFVQQSPYAQEFAGIPFNSQKFQQKWKEVAARDPAGFGQAQHDFIERTHFTPQSRALAAMGLSLNALSPILKDVVWSTAVQHGPNTPIVANALKRVGPNASEADQIKAIYEARWNGGKNFASSTPEVQRSVYNRFFGPQGELALALSRLNSNTTA